MVKINIETELSEFFTCDYCSCGFADGDEAVQIENPWDESLGYMIVDKECHASIEHQKQTVGHVENYRDYTLHQKEDES